MTPAQRQKYRLRYEHECSEDERKAIDQFYSVSHATNLPKRRDKALWDIRLNKRTGKPEASLFGGFIF